MQTFSSYLLNEFMDAPLTWNWVRREDASWKASFTVPQSKQKIEVLFLWMNFFKMYELTFDDRNNGGYHMTGDGNSIKIMSTVADIVKSFMRERGSKAPGLRFSADQNETGKVKLYTRFAKMLAQSYGMKLEIMKMAGEQVYILTKESK